VQTTLQLSERPCSTRKIKPILTEPSPLAPQSGALRLAPGTAQQPEVILRAKIEIPEQKLQVSMSLRRNDNKQLPASHTFEIVFTLSPGFRHGGISNVPGLLMKQEETTQGVPLKGACRTHRICSCGEY
jgi:hypothetical protein